MKRRVILIRHAKSSWDDPVSEDHARVLNARGRASAPAIGKWLALRGDRPDLMLVSTAARTVETAELIRDVWPDAPPPVSYSRALYHASSETLLAELRRTSAATLALVGHNPGIGDLAQELTQNPPDHPSFDAYPTAATTVLDFEDEISPGKGYCVGFVVPRDLI